MLASAVTLGTVYKDTIYDYVVKELFDIYIIYIYI